MKKLLIYSFIISNLLYAKDIQLGESQIISTTGFETNLTSENKNVSVITKEEIQKKSYENVEAILRDSNNVNIKDTYFGPVVDIRGNGQRAITRVKVLVDGIGINPLDDAMGSLPLNTVQVSSIERIEVIPGGGSVLNGSGTAGGVVNIITKSDSKKNYLGIDYGNSSFATNHTSISTGYNLTDWLYANIGYSYKEGNGYRYGDNEFSGVLNGGLEFKINEKNSIKFTANKYKGQENTSTPVLKSLLDHDRKTNGFPVESEMERESYSVDYKYSPTENLNFVLTGYTQNFKRNFTEHSIMDEYRNGPFIGYNLPSTMLGTFDETTNGGKIKGQYKYSNGELLFGYDYSDAKLKRNSHISTKGNFYLGLAPFPTSVNIDIFNEVSKETHALYALNKYNVTDKLGLTAGARYEISKLESDRRSRTLVKVPTFILPGMPNGYLGDHKKVAPNSKQTEENFAGEIGLTYSYSQTGSVYTRYERGFISPLPIQMINKDKKGNYTTNNLSSETSDSIEVGFRDYLYGSLISGAVYSSFTNDEITLIQGNSHNPATKYWSYENVDKTRRIGVELGFEQEIGKFVFYENINYINSKVTKGAEKGEKVPFVPDLKLKLGVDYNITKKFSAGIVFNYVGESDIVEYGKDNKPGATKDKTIRSKSSGYHYTDLSFNYNVNENLLLKAGINNLFDSKFYFEETKDYGIVAPERTYYVGGSLKF
jgi:iron complex outermembrane receptor protein